MCTKMLRNLSEERTAEFHIEFHATTVSYSIKGIARLDGAFSESFELEGSPIEGQQKVNPQTSYLV